MPIADTHPDMALYETRTVFHSGSTGLITEGSHIYYEGEPGQNLKPLNDVAKGRFAKAEAKRAEHAAQLAHKESVINFAQSIVDGGPSKLGMPAPAAPTSLQAELAPEQDKALAAENANLKQIIADMQRRDAEASGRPRIAAPDVSADGLEAKSKDELVELLKAKGINADRRSSEANLIALLRG